MSMLPDLQACVLCEDVRAEMSGQQTLVGIIAAIPAPVLPVAFFKLCVWTRWCGGEGSFKQRTILVAGEDDSVLGEAQVEFHLNDVEAHATNVNVFGGLKFEKYGLHHIEIHLEDELRLRIPLPVIQVQRR